MKEAVKKVVTVPFADGIKFINIPISFKNIVGALRDEFLIQIEAPKSKYNGCKFWIPKCLLSCGKGYVKMSLPERKEYFVLGKRKSAFLTARQMVDAFGGEEWLKCNGGME